MPARSQSTLASVIKAPQADQSREDAALAAQFQEVRRFTESICEPLEPEDCVIQPMPDASPTKWHLAHTSWFFETFLIAPRTLDYQPFHPKFGFLFNSYYNAIGDRQARPNRGLISRPSLEEVYEYRSHVDRQMHSLLDSGDAGRLEGLTPLLELGLHHEQQHQELILTDILFTLSCNPLRPAYHNRIPEAAGTTRPLQWIGQDEGLHWIGHQDDSFAFDNELPRHRVFTESFQLADRTVTNGEFLQFMEDSGYSRPELWLSDGWNTVLANSWCAPLYWEKHEGRWWTMTLSGMREVVADEPVCHVSYYEADAYARWADARLPTEAEWEIAAATLPMSGNFADDRYFQPLPAGPSAGRGLKQLFGDVWEWTGSAYLPYPGYHPAEGALGEYNGKFMCNQMVLRGGSCATSRNHIRASYRNFFPPDARWQFSGIRLARDA
jgi:ergothioneine biosynthesis protein EgtB